MGSLYFVGADFVSHFLKLLAVPFFQPGRTALKIGLQQESCGDWKSLDLLRAPLSFPVLRRFPSTQLPPPQFLALDDQISLSAPVHSPELPQGPLGLDPSSLRIFPSYKSNKA